ncbi:type II toxin-antitoxin system VapC family toxin [Patulibacter brassicae]|uniref:Ribonuclease VapC n=1 Tax=Patulibacter brassicae TaxID=1705717 RepID=A0ABU4VF98_9ACTN|nr:type II toxin-antitoxin system VapC family toxin [Patulibacter brassicae]MDX8150501.1 type II toxin-antitoxin system VapC family toxin [Patulibacter brassicae]
MNGWLLDTNVLSELRRPRPDDRVRAWAASAPAPRLFLSVIVVGEIRKGIERVTRRDPAQAQSLETWLTGLLTAFAGRIVPVDLAVADRWGRIEAARPTPGADALLAATAIVHDLTFVTRNVRDVEGTGARLLNPWEVA